MATINPLAFLSKKKRWLWAKPSCGVHLPFGFWSHGKLSWPLAEDWTKVLPSNSSVVLPGGLVPALTRHPTTHREPYGSSSQLCRWTIQNCFREWESIELKPGTLFARSLGGISLFVRRGTGLRSPQAHLVCMAAQWGQEGNRWHPSIIYLT